MGLNPLSSFGVTWLFYFLFPSLKKSIDEQWGGLVDEKTNSWSGGSRFGLVDILTCLCRNGWDAAEE